MRNGWNRLCYHNGKTMFKIFKWGNYFVESVDALPGRLPSSDKNSLRASKSSTYAKLELSETEGAKDDDSNEDLNYELLEDPLKGKFDFSLGIFH